MAENLVIALTPDVGKRLENHLAKFLVCPRLAGDNYLRAESESVLQGARDGVRRNGSGEWQNRPIDRVTHKKVNGFDCRFIDDVAAVKERAIEMFWAEVSLEDMQRDFSSVKVVVVKVSWLNWVLTVAVQVDL